MSLYSDLEKDVMAFNVTFQKPPQVGEIFEMMCKLIEHKINHLEQGLIAQTDYNPDDTDWETLEDY